MIRFCRDALRVMCQPCREQTQRISRAHDAPLSAGARWGLRFHLAFCRRCRRFARQLALLRELIANLGREVEAGETLPADVRARVRARLDGEAQDF